MIGAIVGLIGALVVGVVVIGLVLALLGVVFGVAVGLLALTLKVLPILLIGWVAVKLVQRAERRRGALSASDQRWLDSH
ncbi:MAG TPA: hypothetical protein VGO40_08685 [Longimicrobium sp.]|jgi:ABC-type phosphate transport system permease subunit|nr:hypothetical protein [Longimicrobium sp.]